MDTTALAKKILGMVPFAATIGVEVVEATPTAATCTLAFRPDLGNHVGTPHAGVVFSLAESCSGAVAGAMLGDKLMSGLIVVLKSTSIRYRRPVAGAATATAKLLGDPAEIIAAIESEGRADFDIEVHIVGENGGDGAFGTFTWAARGGKIG